MNKKISKFPKGFFQIKRPTITASEALKNEEPFFLVEEKDNKYIKSSKKEKASQDTKNND